MGFSVSIHAPREGCDLTELIIVRRPSSFNSRTPGGVRLMLLCNAIALASFQFTHPGRGATTLQLVQRGTDKSFNSRTPGGVRQAIVAEGDVPSEFQFTHPGRGATYGRQHAQSNSCVSIHAPREGCDLSCHILHTTRATFQFTHPGRGATPPTALLSRGERFQFTHPGRGATANGRSGSSRSRVSIHAPREGCDRSCCCYRF